MKRMWDINELIRLINEYAPGFDPSAIENGTIADILGLDSDGGVVKGNLFGKYVRIVDSADFAAMDNTAKRTLFREGFFVSGTISGSYNPIFLPATGVGSHLRGMAITRVSDDIYGGTCQLIEYQYTSSGTFSFINYGIVFKLDNVDNNNPITVRTRSGNGIYIPNSGPVTISGHPVRYKHVIKVSDDAKISIVSNRSTSYLTELSALVSDINQIGIAYDNATGDRVLYASTSGDNLNLVEVGSSGVGASPISYDATTFTSDDIEVF